MTLGSGTDFSLAGSPSSPSFKAVVPQGWGLRTGEENLPRAFLLKFCGEGKPNTKPYNRWTSAVFPQGQFLADAVVGTMMKKLI